MVHPLLQAINQVLKLPAPLLEQFHHRMEPISIAKGDYFLRAGETCRKVALLTQGAFYAYYQKDGQDIIEDFCLEGCFLADYPAFLQGTGARKNFKALENATLLTISKADLDALYLSDPAFERAGRLIAEFLFTNWESKLRDTIFLSPTERYQALIRTRPDIPQRVPQYLIASFLNITPQYLSQIRKKLISSTS